MRSDRYLDAPEFRALRFGRSPVVLRPARCPSERQGHAALERSNCALVIQRAEYLRSRHSSSPRSGSQTSTTS
jgi:hypothetical protein